MRSGVDDLKAVSSVRAVQPGAQGSLAPGSMGSSEAPRSVAGVAGLLALSEQWSPNRRWQSERTSTLSVELHPVITPPYHQRRDASS